MKLMEKKARPRKIPLKYHIIGIILPSLLKRADEWLQFNHPI